MHVVESNGEHTNAQAEEGISEEVAQKVRLSSSKQSILY